MIDHALLDVAGEELAFRVVAREAERRLRQVVRAEGEEVRVLSDPRPQRGLGADRVGDVEAGDDADRLAVAGGCDDEVRRSVLGHCIGCVSQG